MGTISMFINRGMDKEEVAHIYSGIFLNQKKDSNNTICSNMDGPRDYRTKYNKSDRQRKTNI